MKKLDLATWSRYKHYQFFRNFDYPHFNLVANVDIGKLKEYCSQEGLSFFKGVLYVTVRAANEIEPFRLRIRENEVVLHDSVHPSYTSMTDAEVFSFTDVAYDPNPEVFFENCRIGEEQVKSSASLEDDPHRDDYLFISSIPWISFTSFVHPIQMSPVDSVPRISWGKFFKDFEGWKMPLSMQAHHALMDGLEMGQFFRRVQELLDDPSSTFQK